MNEYLKLAKNAAKISYKNNEGGPFGAVITDLNGNIIAISSNKVLLKKDPTAHAEIEVIREASSKLQNYDLSECIMYSSCEPCPMCLSAIIWANIKTVYYGCNKTDAEKIGFRDEKIYKYFENKNEEMLKLKNIDRKECLELFDEYLNLEKQIY